MNAERNNPEPSGQTYPYDVDLELEELFVKARGHTPNPERLTRMLRAVPRPSARKLLRLWQSAAALAACAAAISLIVLAIAPPGQSQAFALSQVADAMRSAPIVKRTRDNGAVTWQSPGRFSAWLPADRSYVSYHDVKRGHAYRYEFERNALVISTCPRSKMHGAPFHALEDFIRDAEARGASLDDRWRRRHLTVDGRPIIELTGIGDYCTDHVVTIDGESGRILQWEGSQHVTEFEYPESGPRDIYDLGVPRDTRVVDGTAGPELLALRDKVKTEQAAGFGAYLMVLVLSDSKSVLRAIRDGHRWRVESIRDRRGGNMTIEQLAAHAKKHATLEPIDPRVWFINFCDGTLSTHIQVRGYDRRKRYPTKNVGTRAGSRLWLGLLEGQSFNSRFDQQHHFFRRLSDRQDEYLPVNERGWVGHRARGQARATSRPWLRERWYDPAHGYRLALERFYNFPDAPWQLKENWQADYTHPSGDAVEASDPAGDPAVGTETEVLEWAELRPGQWYPKLTRIRQVITDKDGDWRLWDAHPLEGHPPEGYRYIHARPLEHVDEKWFEIPAEWSAETARQP